MSGTDNDILERPALEERYGRVWDTKQLMDEFSVESFMRPFVIARRRSDGRKCILEFQHMPRFYFRLTEE